MAKNYLNIVKLKKFPSLYYEIDVIDNDGDVRIRIGSTSYDVYGMRMRKKKW